MKDQTNLIVVLSASMEVIHCLVVKQQFEALLLNWWNFHIMSTVPQTVAMNNDCNIDVLKCVSCWVCGLQHQRTSKNIFQYFKKGTPMVF